jgi:non-specific serine/threonine protein kinase
VLVHKLLCRGTVEETFDCLIDHERGGARHVVDAGGEKRLTEMADADLLGFGSLDVRRATGGL